MFSDVLKNQKMLCPSDAIDVAGSRALDMAAGQLGGAWVCSGSQKCQWEVCLCEIFGSEIFGDEKTQSPQIPKGV